MSLITASRFFTEESLFLGIDNYLFLVNFVKKQSVVYIKRRKENLEMKRIVLLRHGESAWNKRKSFYGLDRCRSDRKGSCRS